MAVIGWRTDVNTKILDSTTITMGDGGFIEDTTSNGFKARRASSLANPDKYQVTMDFNWLEKDKDGNSEFDRFQIWYKYRHQYGSNPFWFESISRFNINGPVVSPDGYPSMCQYKITSAPSFQKSGFCMRCTMTWEEVYSGLINASKPVFNVDHIEAENGKVYVIYTTEPTERPTPTTHNITYSKNLTSTSIYDFTRLNTYRVFAEDNKVVFVTDTLPEGTYKICIDYEFSSPKKTVVITI